MDAVTTEVHRGRALHSARRGEADSTTRAVPVSFAHERPRSGDRAGDPSPEAHGLRFHRSSWRRSPRSQTTKPWTAQPVATPRGDLQCWPPTRRMRPRSQEVASSRKTTSARSVGPPTGGFGFRTTTSTCAMVGYASQTASAICAASLSMRYALAPVTMPRTRV